MFDKIALSWQRQYEMRWCITQHSHLFYYTWNEEEIYGTIHIIWTTSCAHKAVRGGGWGSYSSPGLTEKANTWAGGVSRCLFCAFPTKDRCNFNIGAAMAPGRLCFKVVLSQVPWGWTVAAIPDHLQAHLTISQDTNSWLIFFLMYEITVTSFPAALYFSNHSKENHTPVFSLM